MPTNPSFNLSDYEQSLTAIERRRKLAQALQQQSLQPIEGQQAPGLVIPNSPFQGVNKLAQAYIGGSINNQSDQQEQAVSQKYSNDLANALMQAQSAVKGSPSIPPDPQEIQQSQDQGTPAPQASPAQRPDINAAIQALMKSPTTQPAALSMMGQDLQRQSFMNSVGTQGPPQAGGTPQASPGTFGGPAGGVPMQTWLQADPSGKSYVEQLAKDRAPVNVRPGGTVYIPGQGPQFTAPQGGQQTTWQGNQPQAGVIPGAPEAAGTMAEASALGKSMGEFHPTQQASGAIVPTLGRDIKPSPSGNPPSPKVRSQDPWANIPKLQTPSGIGQTTFQREYQAKLGEDATKLGEKFGSQADMSNQRLAYNQQAAELVDKADTGPLALQSAQVKNWLVSNFKIPEEDFKNTPSATIALNKDLLNAAAEKAKQRYGPKMSNAEVMLQIKQGAPNVDMTKAAIKYLLDSDSAMASYHIKQSEDYGKYIQMGGDPMRFEGWYARNFPMAAAVGEVKMGTQPSSQLVDDLVRKYAKP